MDRNIRFLIKLTNEVGLTNVKLPFLVAHASYSPHYTGRLIVILDPIFFSKLRFLELII